MVWPPFMKRGQESGNLGELRKAKLLEAAEPGPTFTKLDLGHERFDRVSEAKLRASTNEKYLTWLGIE